MVENAEELTLREQAQLWLRPKDQSDQQKRDALAQAYQLTFTSPEGQIVLRDLAAKAGVLQHYIPEPGTALEMGMIWEGRRQIFVEICNQLAWSPMEMVALAHAQSADILRRQSEQAIGDEDE